MPIYEYACAKCDVSFEALLVRSDDEVKCPECGAKTVDKQMSGFAVGATSGSSGYDAMSEAPACPPGTGGCGRCM